MGQAVIAAPDATACGHSGCSGFAVLTVAAPTKSDVAQPMSALRRAQREALSPVDRIEAALQGWAAFAIMPVIAGLAFGSRTAMKDVATVAVLIASAASAALALLVGRIALPPASPRAVATAE